ncbi:organic hydroperoxide resistance protein [Lysobacter sp. cf310]|uniref:organic hydroperoxide resistance protein n=1 Tax=Lysobacter sp. cf310 TaxID=1761790 RepID=UPI0008F193E8|nr:organic hydroperoxide resistance protein [Lysobacter sp. cf310]SFK92533.1 peroxiredoxin, Ohr subfamily [Lysobacter sp. cf310]
MSSTLETVIYTAHTHVTGGRIGSGTSSDGAIDVQLSSPGSGRPGTNPEQLFGIGYSACFIGALQFAAAARKIKLPADASVDADVALGQIASGEYQLAVTLNVNLPGLDEDLKRELVAAAHQTCPYSRMTRGNVNVELAIG